MKEDESCDAHSILTIKTIPSETLGSMDYLTKEEHITPQVPPIGLFPPTSLTGLHSTDIMGLRQRSNSCPEIEVTTNHPFPTNELKTTSQGLKLNLTDKQFDGSSQSIHNNSNNNRPLSRQTRGSDENNYDMENNPWSDTKGNVFTGHSRPESHLSIFNRMKNHAKKICLRWKQERGQDWSVDFPLSERSTIDFSERYQHSVGTATSLVNRAGPSCLALSHFLVS